MLRLRKLDGNRSPGGEQRGRVLSVESRINGIG
jgi:hypothetical protein